MNTQVPLPELEEHPREMLRRCGGYYECRKEGSVRTTPLVGYAGKYMDASGNEKQWVGDIYANFAKLEEHGPMLAHVGGALLGKGVIFSSRLTESLAGFCGAPLGGLGLATTMATQSCRQYIFPEKEVIVPKTDSSREKSRLIFDRHEPQTGESYAIVEDVCNNFSTTRDLIQLIEAFGAKVSFIFCFLNRSLEVDNEYTPWTGLTIPVISLWREKIMQYRQDNPFVSGDIEAGNICWKPKKKDEWIKLTTV